MAYEVELDGSLLQARYFSIDGESLIFKDTQMMCADITGFSHGATVMSINGIQKKPEYNFRFIDSSGDTISFEFTNPHNMDLRGSDVNDRIVEEIWSSFGNRIFTETVHKISSGAIVKVDDIEFSRAGAMIRHKPLFGKAREVVVPWSEMDVELDGSQLKLSDGRESKVNGILGLRSVYNARVMLRIFEKIGEDENFIALLSGK